MPQAIQNNEWEGKRRHLQGVFKTSDFSLNASTVINILKNCLPKANIKFATILYIFYYGTSFKSGSGLFLLLVIVERKHCIK